jgi:hypothetical protein
VVFDVVGLNDVGQRRGVKSKEDWAQHRPLWDPTGEADWVRGNAVDDDCLSSVREIGEKPGKSRVGDAKSVLEAVEQDRVIDSIKGSREIKKSEERDVARVSGQKEIVKNMYKGCLCTVVFAVGGLERTEEVVGGEVKVELVEDNLLKEFGQEGEIGYRPVVFQLVWVEVVFLEKRSDDSRFEDVRDRAGVERNVDDVSDERQKVWETVREERGRERIEFTGFEAH